MSMFCYQCEQTAQGTGCTKSGVCGKSPETAALQDLLLQGAKALGWFAHRARQLGAKDHDVDVFALEALFSTVTNVNFDVERLQGLIYKAAETVGKAKVLYEDACKSAGQTPEEYACPVGGEPAGDVAGLVAQGQSLSIAKR